MIVSAGVLATATPLEPTARWVVDFAEQQCVASRTYKGEDGEVTLAFRQSPYDDITQLYIITLGKASKWTEQLDARVAVGGAEPVRTFLLRSAAGKGKDARIVHKLNLSPEQRGALATAEAITLTASGAVSGHFRLSKMPDIAKLLDECTHDLRTYWNMGEASATVAVPAKPRTDVRLLFSSADYPSDALAYGQEGSAVLMLLIDETGAMKSCQVVRAEGAPVFDAMGCQVLLDRAKFSPALDIRGKPMRSVYTSPRVVFRMAR
jgi:TonB family protein